MNKYCVNQLYGCLMLNRAEASSDCFIKNWRPTWLLKGCLMMKSPKMVYYEPHREKTDLSGFPTRSDTNQAVQPQKMARNFKFWI